MSLFETLASLETPQIDPELRRVLADCALDDMQRAKLARYCTGDRLERTGRAVVGETVQFSPDEVRRPLITTALAERVSF